MKSIALVIALSAGCTSMGADPVESNETPAAAVTPDAPAGDKNTESWDVNATPAAKLESLWPSGAQHSQLIYRLGPARLGYAATLVFVVTAADDTPNVAHVYWVPNGSTLNDLSSAWASALNTRTTNQSGPLFLWGGGVGGGIGTPPIPRPMVDNFAISAAWLKGAKTAAVSFNQDFYSFNQIAE
jgi:hypothetical protein